MKLIKILACAAFVLGMAAACSKVEVKTEEAPATEPAVEAPAAEPAKEEAAPAKEEAAPAPAKEEAAPAPAPAKE